MFTQSEPTAAELEEARVLISEGYRQTSRKFRLVARLPEGMDGRGALRWGMLQYAAVYEKRNRTLSAHEEAWVERMSEADAGNHFRRVYAQYPAIGLSKELSIGVFAAFRKLGGEPA